jgi:hypothetical protein
MRPGVSTEMRKLFLKKHIIYVLAMIFLQLCNLLTNYYELFKPEIEISRHINQDQDLEKRISNITFTVGFFVGIILAVIRSNDPYFRYVISQ